jgi:hypothetical protein
LIKIRLKIGRRLVARWLEKFFFGNSPWIKWIDTGTREAGRAMSRQYFLSPKFAELKE